MRLPWVDEEFLQTYDRVLNYLIDYGRRFLVPSTSLPLYLPHLDDLSDDGHERLLLNRALRSLDDVLATVPDLPSRPSRCYDPSVLPACLVVALLFDSVDLFLADTKGLVDRHRAIGLENRTAV